MLWIPFVSGAEEPQPFPALYPHPEAFERALAAEQREPPPDRHVTGITVPHHLLAADLIARGFQLASRSRYERVIVLLPDHFKRCRHPAATTRRSFVTALGRVATDSAAAETLLKKSALIEESDLFAGEHGIQALLPFVARLFPDAKVLPVALRITSQEADWRGVIDALRPLVTSRTLVVQSTDFSHYLPVGPARARDQETLHVLASGNLASVAKLRQPAHLDSRAAQYVQMALQREVHGASPTVIANRNSQHYLPWSVQSSTSYVVQVYEAGARDGASAPWPIYDNDQVFYFAGDTFFGRFLLPLLNDPERAGRLREKILKLTGGAPLIVNLEGVLVPDTVVPRSGLLGMPQTLALLWLKSLNIKAVSVANNHALDFGPDALEAQRLMLTNAGITVTGHGELADLGPFRLAAFTDLSNRGETRTKLISDEDLRLLKSRPWDPPLFAFLHWGREFQSKPGLRETEIIQRLQDAGVSAIVGAHPHVASSGVDVLAGGRGACAYSLGNFIFDQPSPSSGSLLEVRFFSQHTYALRWHALGNLYDDAPGSRKR